MRWKFARVSFDTLKLYLANAPVRGCRALVGAVLDLVDRSVLGTDSSTLATTRNSRSRPTFVSNAEDLCIDSRVRHSERWLRQSIESVLAPTDTDWELCVAYDCSTASHVRRVLAEYAARDRRMRIPFRAENDGIELLP
jgi:hypothetical protein